MYIWRSCRRDCPIDGKVELNSKKIYIPWSEGRLRKIWFMKFMKRASKSHFIGEFCSITDIGVSNGVNDWYTLLHLAAVIFFLASLKLKFILKPNACALTYRIYILIPLINSFLQTLVHKRRLLFIHAIWIRSRRGTVFIFAKRREI